MPGSHYQFTKDATLHGVGLCCNALSSMRGTTIFLDIVFGNSMIRRLALSLGWKHHVCPNCNLLPADDGKGNVLLIWSTGILRISFKGAVYETLFFGC